MLFKSLLLATLASLAFASPAPGGEYDHGDWNWGKDKCYVKHVTYTITEKGYKVREIKSDGIFTIAYRV
jgi:hypothetical protein